MTIYYYPSKEDETLDYVCWRHYVRNNLIGTDTDPFNMSLLNNFFNRFDAEDSGINGIIEKILEANPLLSHYIYLPRDIKIILPDINELPVDLSLQDLWN